MGQGLVTPSTAHPHTSKRVLEGFGFDTPELVRPAQELCIFRHEEFLLCALAEIQRDVLLADLHLTFAAAAAEDRMRLVMR